MFWQYPEANQQYQKPAWFWSPVCTGSLHTPKKEHSDPETAGLLKKPLRFQTKMHYEIFVFQMQKCVGILYPQRKNCTEVLKVSTDLYVPKSLKKLMQRQKLHFSKEILFQANH